MWKKSDLSPAPGLLPTLSLLLVVLFGMHAPVRSLECRRATLGLSATWSFSATWDQEGDHLMIVDLAGSRILRYRKDGTPLGSIEGRPDSGLGFDRPVVLVTAPGGYLLKNGSTRLIWLDDDFKPIRFLDLEMTRSQSRVKATPIFRRLQLKSFVRIGNELVGYGPLLLKDKLLDRAWVRLDLDSGELVEITHEVDFTLPGLDLESMTAQLMAQVHGAAYALRFLEPPRIHQITPERRELRAFPGGFDHLPRLPRNEGMETSAVRFRALERSSMPVSLYGSGDYLYLLTRQPRPGGETRWRVSQIEPDDDVLVRTLNLPTTANHLYLVPGSEYWAVVEKGPVIASGQQEISALLLIPTPWIEDVEMTALMGEDRACP